MFVLEARRMGYRTIILDPDPLAPAAHIANDHILAPLSDRVAAQELAARADVITLEWENADVAALRDLERSIPVRPGTKVLEIAQNRLLEKKAARSLGLHTADFAHVDSIDELRAGVARLGTPCVLKTATGGYDGKGQWVIRSPEECEAAFQELGGGDRGLILEGWVEFTMEASVICARSVDGEVASFPVAENIHRNGILDFTVAPARLPEAIREKAIEIGETMTRGLDVIGLLAVELFVEAGGRILVNEIAPRPHNSGHYTWEACSVSQFEQQLRAVCGLPLAQPTLLRPAAMANLLGEHVGTGAGIESVASALATPLLALHLYGKSESRPRRKMGHLTALSDDASEAYRTVREARTMIEEEYSIRGPASR